MAIRKIIHVDMDAFYASVEQRNRPELRGKPVVVGGRPDSRGVVSTCSYEARRYGIHSAMPTAEAYRRCPSAVFVTDPDFGEYHRVSQEVQEIFHKVTGKVEPLSLDEAYLDVTENKLGEPSATRIAEEIRQQIYQETALTASAGVSYNKSLAKIASDWIKPDGLTIIPPDKADEFLLSLPVSKFWGVGPVTAARMTALGIHTGGDLRNLPLWKLTEIFGKSGPWYYNLCRGMDDRPVESIRMRKSLGKERTFESDITDIRSLKTFLANLAKSVWKELESHELQGKTVTVKVKYSDFQQVTRSRTRMRPIKSFSECSALAESLLDQTEAGRRPIRLVGISISSFIDNSFDSAKGQLALEFGLDAFDL